MNKVVPVSIAKEVDVPEVRRNKELMKNFNHSGYIYRKGMENLEAKWYLQEQRRKAGLPIKSEDAYFTAGEEDYAHAVPAPDLLNKMYKEMTYEKALDLLQSFHEMMTTDRDNKNGLKFLGALGRSGGWLVDLALLRLEQWNHDHRGLANALALAIVEENENQQKQTAPAQKEIVKVENKERTKGLPSIRKQAEIQQKAVVKTPRKEVLLG